MLRSLQQELTDKATEKRSKKVAKKYRMVKFFGEYIRLCTVRTNSTGTVPDLIKAPLKINYRPWVAHN